MSLRVEKLREELVELKTVFYPYKGDACMVNAVWDHIEHGTRYHRVSPYFATREEAISAMISGHEHGFPRVMAFDDKFEGAILGTPVLVK